LTLSTVATVNPPTVSLDAKWGVFQPTSVTPLGFADGQTSITASSGGSIVVASSAAPQNGQLAYDTSFVLNVGGTVYRVDLTTAAVRNQNRLNPGASGMANLVASLQAALNSAVLISSSTGAASPPSLVAGTDSSGHLTITTASHANPPSLLVQ